MTRGADPEYQGPRPAIRRAWDRACVLVRYAEIERSHAWGLLQRLTSRISRIEASALVRNWEASDEALRHARWLQAYYGRQWEAVQRMSGLVRLLPVEVRQCRTCRRRLPLDAEHFHRERNNRWRYSCRDCRSGYERKRWIKRKIGRKAG